jgi:Ca2+:H+ antiporter
MRAATTVKPQRPPRSARSRAPLPAPERALLALLIFLPAAVIAQALHWSAVAVFACAGLAIVPLAGVMGRSTEQLASRFGAGVGGLLNATFGNAAELIIALAALQRGLDDIVKASLTGSIIGNGLLVLGLAIVAGGIGRERQKFDRSAASAGATLLALAAIALVIPAVFHVVGRARGAAEPHRRRSGGLAGVERSLSLEIAVILVVIYLLSLWLSLRTHRHLYAGQVHAAPASGSAMRPTLELLAATGGVAWMSELLVGAVTDTSSTLGLTPVFVGVIVIAVIGNAAEHSTAVLMAMKNQMDLALNIAIGSGIQIALFVAPILVFVSYAMRRVPMDLRFTPFEVVAVLATVGIVSLVAQDGESNWLEGAMLLAVYAILAVAFFFLP